MIGRTRDSAVVACGTSSLRQPEPDRRGRREPDRAGLRGAALEVALALEDLQVVMDGGGRGQADRAGDLAHRRRIAAGAQRRRDEVEDLDLAFGVVLRHSRLLAAIIPNGCSMSSERAGSAASAGVGRPRIAGRLRVPDTRACVRASARQGSSHGAIGHQAGSEADQGPSGQGGLRPRAVDDGLPAAREPVPDVRPARDRARARRAHAGRRARRCWPARPATWSSAGT